jgi:hypothetical protein
LRIENATDAATGQTAASDDEYSSNGGVGSLAHTSSRVILRASGLAAAIGSATREGCSACVGTWNFIRSWSRSYSVTLSAAWGDQAMASRHTLEHILTELRKLGLVLLDAMVDSLRARVLPMSGRRLHLRDDRTFPIDLRRERSRPGGQGSCQLGD